MTDETIVAVYDTSEHAALAVQDLEAAGVPSSAISQHAAAGVTGSVVTGSATTAAPAHEKGFWASLFGGEPDHPHDTTVYDRSLEAGSTVVTVKAPEQHLNQVMDILERHNPVDIDERASGYGVGQTTGFAAGETTTGRATGAVPLVDTGSAPLATGRTDVGASDSEAISLSEETLAVGKRAINRGTTRVRRYVVETPVQEQISLRDENVSVERRPVTEGRPVTNADFSDKVIEVTETAEEPVISKTARVKEEVVVHKGATERTETIRDTVRREDVEITKDLGTERSTGVTDTPATRDPRI